MKRLKTIMLLFILIASVSLFAACADGKEIKSKSPLATRYTPERQEVVTDYHYKYNFLVGEFQLIPEVRTANIPEKYEVYYHIVYTDGSFEYRWEAVDKGEYEQVKAELEGVSE